MCGAPAVWKKRWSVGAKARPHVRNMSTCADAPGTKQACRIDTAFKAPDRLAVRLGVRAEDNIDQRVRTVCKSRNLHPAVETTRRFASRRCRDSSRRGSARAVVRLWGRDEGAVVQLDGLSASGRERQGQISVSPAAPRWFHLTGQS